MGPGSLLIHMCSHSPLRFQTLFAPANGSPSLGLWAVWLCPWGLVQVLACHRCSGLSE